MNEVCEYLDNLKFVACKVYLPNYENKKVKYSDDILLALAKVEIAKSLKHDSLSTFLDIEFVCDGNMMSIFYMNNDPLLEVKLQNEKNKKNWNWETILIDIFSGLIFLHENDIINVGLNVKNISINIKTGQAKILNYLNYYLSNFDDKSTVSKSYEQINNLTITEKTDYWFLAIVLIQAYKCQLVSIDQDYYEDCSSILMKDTENNCHYYDYLLECQNLNNIPEDLNVVLESCVLLNFQRDLITNDTKIYIKQIVSELIISNKRKLPSRMYDFYECIGTNHLKCDYVKSQIQPYSPVLCNSVLYSLYKNTYMKDFDKLKYEIIYEINCQQELLDVYKIYSFKTSNFIKKLKQNLDLIYITIFYKNEYANINLSLTEKD
ncbi:hypothetical protein A3Q56_05701, partial [Intoshia linei]